MAHSKGLRDVFTYHSFVHAMAGATGGVVAMATFYPLDTIRSRLQLDENLKKSEQGILAIIKHLIHDEGFFTLYRGLIPVLQSLCISSFVYFYTFHALKALNKSQRSQSAARDLLLGAIAGVVNVLTTTPFWVVNTRLKMKGIKGHDHKVTKDYNNLTEGLVFVAKTEGVKGLWAGTIPSLMLVINPALQFMMYETLKRKLSKAYGDLPSITYFAIGAAAKAFATVLTYPIQLVQSKLRHGGADVNKNLPSNAGTWRIILHILKVQGIKGVFRGLEAKLLQTVLTAALMFATYEKIVRYVFMLLGKNTLRVR